MKKANKSLTQEELTSLISILTAYKELSDAIESNHLSPLVTKLKIVKTALIEKQVKNKAAQERFNEKDPNYQPSYQASYIRPSKRKKK